MQNTEPYIGRIVKHLSHQVKEVYKFERGKHQLKTYAMYIVSNDLHTDLLHAIS